MTLATRCPGCGTTFRIVSDQLKLRKGLVKCGKCLYVFNGVEHLRYFSAEETNVITIPAPEPQALAPAPTATSPKPVATAAPTATTPRAIPKSPQPSNSSVRATTPSVPSTARAAPPPRSPAPAPVPVAPARTTPRAADALKTSPAVARELVAPRAAAAPAAKPADPLSPLTLLDVAPPGTTRAPTKDDEPLDLPNFMRERVLSRREKMALRIGSAVAALVLALQVLYVYRANIAASVPALRAPLALMCDVLPGPLSCEVGLPRHIDELRITAAELQAGASNTQYTLLVTIRNDASVAQAWPAIDLALADVRNAIVARRAIRPEEYLRLRADAAQKLSAGVTPNREESITVPVRVADGPVIGYTIGIFYP
ncbi:MAG TPA: DUF3426 domain-containing protein [Burkholderiaceae bacterium]|nr:DUF3426 domain-containing protein [Burkholderiaceae bacterium]